MKTGNFILIILIIIYLIILTYIIFNNNIDEDNIFRITNITTEKAGIDETIRSLILQLGYASDVYTINNASNETYNIPTFPNLRHIFDNGVYDYIKDVPAKSLDISTNNSETGQKILNTYWYIIHNDCVLLVNKHHPLIDMSEKEYILEEVIKMNISNNLTKMYFMQHYKYKNKNAVSFLFKKTLTYSDLDKYEGWKCLYEISQYIKFNNISYYTISGNFNIVRSSLKKDVNKLFPDAYFTGNYDYCSCNYTSFVGQFDYIIVSKSFGKNIKARTFSPLINNKQHYGLTLEINTNNKNEWFTDGVSKKILKECLLNTNNDIIIENKVWDDDDTIGDYYHYDTNIPAPTRVGYHMKDILVI